MGVLFVVGNGPAGGVLLVFRFSCTSLENVIARTPLVSLKSKSYFIQIGPERWRVILIHVGRKKNKQIGHLSSFA